MNYYYFFPLNPTPTFRKSKKAKLFEFILKKRLQQ